MVREVAAMASGAGEVIGTSCAGVGWCSGVAGWHGGIDVNAVAGGQRGADSLVTRRAGNAAATTPGWGGIGTAVTIGVCAGFTRVEDTRIIGESVGLCKADVNALIGMLGGPDYDGRSGDRGDSVAANAVSG